MNDEFHSWLIVAPDYASTVTYATPVSIEQVRHDYPGAVVTPAIDCTVSTATLQKHPTMLKYAYRSIETALRAVSRNRTESAPNGKARF